MSLKLMAGLLLGMMWLMIGCAGVPAPSLVSPTNQADQPLPIVIRQDKSEAKLEAIVAEALAVSEDSVSIIGVEQLDWMDACLGLPQADELCAQVIVPGFRATAETQHGEYVVNGDREKRNIRLMPISATQP